MPLDSSEVMELTLSRSLFAFSRSSVHGSYPCTERCPRDSNDEHLCFRRLRTAPRQRTTAPEDIRTIDDGSGIAEDRLRPFGDCLSTQGGKVLLRIFEEARVQDVLRLAGERGAAVHAVVPRTQSLEDLFVGEVKAR